MSLQSIEKNNDCFGIYKCHSFFSENTNEFRKTLSVSQVSKGILIVVILNIL